VNFWSDHGLELIAIVLGSNIISTVITTIATRQTTAFKAFTDAYQALAARVMKLEDEIQTVEKNLEREQEEHSRTRELLRISLRHIRDVLEWSAGSRERPIPAVPAELTTDVGAGTVKLCPKPACPN
jgi:hypothetical protein